MSTVERAAPELKQQILAVEDRRRQALVDVDLATLDELFDDLIVHIHAPGVVNDKAQLLEHTATRRPYLQITRGELEVRVVGDVAVVTGPLTNRLRTQDGGERTLSGVVTQVLRRDDGGRWTFVSFQMTPYGERAWPTLPSETPEPARAEAAEGSSTGGTGTTAGGPR